MIHLAIGLFVLSATCVVLSIVALVAPSVPDVGAPFLAGSVVAVLTSAALAWYVRHAQL